MTINTETRRGAAGVTTLTLTGAIMLALAVPVCCLALTRQGAAPPASPSQASEAAQTPAFEVDAWFPAHGVSLESIGLVKKNGRRPSSVLVLPDNAADELIARWKKEKRIAGNSWIKTPTDEAVPMNIARSMRESETITIIPHAVAGGSIEFTLHGELRTPGDTAFSKKMLATELSSKIQHTDDILTSEFRSRVQAGNTIVVESLDYREHPLEVLAFIRLKVLGKPVTPKAAARPLR